MKSETFNEDVCKKQELKYKNLAGAIKYNEIGKYQNWVKYNQHIKQEKKEFLKKSVSQIVTVLAPAADKIQLLWNFIIMQEVECLPRHKNTYISPAQRQPTKI